MVTPNDYILRKRKVGDCYNNVLRKGDRNVNKPSESACTAVPRSPTVWDFGSGSVINIVEPVGSQNHLVRHDTLGTPICNTRDDGRHDRVPRRNLTEYINDPLALCDYEFHNEMHTQTVGRPTARPVVCEQEQHNGYTYALARGPITLDFQLQKVVYETGHHVNEPVQPSALHFREKKDWSGV